MSAYYTDGCNLSKNGVPIKRLNQFYGKAQLEKQPKSRIFCDGDFVYVLAPYGLCDDCFLMRYQVFREHCFMSKGKYPRSLEDDDVLIQDFYKEPDPFTVMCINRMSGDQALYFSCCYEWCAYFKKPGELVKTLFFHDQKIDLYAFITDLSFGFALFGETFCAQGPTCTILKTDVLATIAVRYGATSLALCGALDQDAQKARLRAAMEYVERQAFRLGCMHVSTSTGGADLSFFNGDGAPLLVSRDHVFGVGSTSSGFAAGFDVEGTRLRAACELVERDAFMRWWARPETAMVIELPAHVRKKFHDLLLSLAHVQHSGPLEGRFLLLLSPFKVPVIALFVTSKTGKYAPGFIMSAAAHHDWVFAATKAFNELRVGMLNFIARLQAGYVTNNNDVDFATVASPEDHARVFYNPSVCSRMPFLAHLLSQKPLDGTVALARQGCSNQAIQDAKNIYYYDCAAQTFEFLGLRVVCTSSPDAIPLQYGFPIHHPSLKPSALSAFETLPHPFP